jgi:hypothetical protein
VTAPKIKVGEMAMFQLGPETGSLAFGAIVENIIWRLRTEIQPPDIVLKEIWVKHPFFDDGRILVIPATYLKEVEI